ncbi:hypothetical protein BOW53_07865 [Solemya pervernicosa gill symbiont]|uniref:Glycine transferase n=1 Tax=Solemya pervernicosa gill symbiont TaxID=642797 RepID=A0A1T2L5R7_9GAMM|nr:WbqC family protein [Solemya pervernicosa gill symbiont]OOZ40380.1 hypothetical protein BOW53_07865 [Solemya pervernicosa gill symbiont]
MKLGIMQPYLFPYIGYFQLIHAVDTFVVFDDVNFIKGGWINRNLILARTHKQLITLPLHGASSSKLINEINVDKKHKMLKSIRQNYSKAPYFEVVYDLLEEIITNQENNLARYLEYGLNKICEYLALDPEWYISSKLQKDNGLRGQAKVLAICEELGATHYINLPGGKLLYEDAVFADRGLQLSFIQPREVRYKQFSKEFIPNLSIIDIIMFNNKEQCEKILEAYDLV